MWRLTMTGRVRRKTTVNIYQTLDKWSVYKYIANITDLCNEEEGKYWMQFQLSTRVSLVFSDWLIFYKYSIRGSRGFLEFAKLNIADITGVKKLVIFHICALPQLYVKVGLPLENFSESAPGCYMAEILPIRLTALSNQSIHSTQETDIQLWWSM